MSQVRICLPLSLHPYVAAAGEADPSVHLPVALGRRWGREASRGGKRAAAQRMPRSRALLAHRWPPSVCISAVLLLQSPALGRGKGRNKLDHVRSLLPAHCPAQDTSQQGPCRREGERSQTSSSNQEPQAPERLEEVGRTVDDSCVQLQ